MADNIPQNPELTNLIAEVAELKEQLRVSVEQSSGLVWNTRNWEAVKTTIEVQEKRFRDYNIELQSVKNLVMTLQGQFQQFQQQRAIELSKMVNYGPTQRRDEDE